MRLRLLKIAARVIETARTVRLAFAACHPEAALRITCAHHEDAGSPASKATSYLPSISDFMIATIQPRHVRLWLAARGGDWPFAAYEVGNLKGAFDRLGRAQPMDHEIPLQDMISAVTAQPLEDIRKAIESKDTTTFSKAYGDLTAACNSCHQATNHGVVVIRAPTRGPVRRPVARGARPAAQQIILDLDATDDPLHGHQEGRFFHGYYDCYCYLPLYVFCGRHLLAAKLRPSNIDASAGSVEEVARMVAQFGGVGRERASCCAPTPGSPREVLMA